MKVTHKLVILQIALKNWFVRLGGAFFFIFLARQLDVENLGLVSLYVLIFNAVEMLVENGVSDAIANNKIKTIRLGLLISQSIATLVTVVAVGGWWASDYLRESIPVHAVAILVAYSYLSAYSFVLQGVLRLESKFGALAKRSVFAVTTAFFGSLFFYLFNPNPDAMLAYFLISSVTSVGFLIVERSNFKKVNAHDEPRLAILHVLRFFSFKVSSFLAGRSLEIFVYIKFGAAGLAALVVGSRIYNVIGYFLKSVLHDYIYDINNEIHSKTKAEQHAAEQQTLITSVMISAPIFLGCAAIAGPLLAVLVGSDKAMLAGGFLKIFCILGFIEVIQFILFTKILATTASFFPVKFQLLRALLFLVVFVSFGTLELNQYVTFSILLSGAVPLLFVLYSLVLGGALVGGSILPFSMYVVSASLMYVVVTLVETNFYDEFGSLVKLVAGIVLGGVTYPLLCFITNYRDFTKRIRKLLNSYKGIL